MHQLSYNNDRLWLTAKLKQLRLQWNEAFRSRASLRLREQKCRFSKVMKEAKCLYSEKLLYETASDR